MQFLSDTNQTVSVSSMPSTPEYAVVSRDETTDNVTVSLFEDRYQSRRDVLDKLAWNRNNERNGYKSSAFVLTTLAKFGFEIVHVCGSGSKTVWTLKKSS
ncbi:hypothetical protein AAVH_16514 [Aphelenchoides avenae]|nr:hypothetical protein AAVH_16514 [Aphelenchus avenae]